MTQGDVHSAESTAGHLASERELIGELQNLAERLLAVAERGVALTERPTGLALFGVVRDEGYRLRAEAQQELERLALLDPVYAGGSVQSARPSASCEEKIHGRRVGHR
jgi:hypothetical protein